MMMMMMMMEMKQLKARFNDHDHQLAREGGRKKLETSSWKGASLGGIKPG